jgi:2-oxoglutarate ferredoxin oxidoreductase subunit alpha
LAPFGEGYRYHITGLLHDPRGFPTSRLDEIQPWIERVFRKIEHNASEIVMWERDGDDDARVVVVAYGSTARSARQAIKMVRARYGRKVGLLRLKTLWPFPEEEVERIGEQAQRIVVAEMNLGQVALEVERLVGRRKVLRVGRADGQMVNPQQIVDAIRAPRTHGSRGPRPGLKKEA